MKFNILIAAILAIATVAVASVDPYSVGDEYDDVDGSLGGLDGLEGLEDLMGEGMPGMMGDGGMGGEPQDPFVHVESFDDLERLLDVSPGGAVLAVFSIPEPSEDTDEKEHEAMLENLGVMDSIDAYYQLASESDFAGHVRFALTVSEELVDMFKVQRDGGVKVMLFRDPLFYDEGSGGRKRYRYPSDKIQVDAMADFIERKLNPEVFEIGAENFKLIEKNALKNVIVLFTEYDRSSTPSKLTFAAQSLKDVARASAVKGNSFVVLVNSDANLPGVNPYSFALCDDNDSECDVKWPVLGVRRISKDKLNHEYFVMPDKFEVSAALQFVESVLSDSKVDPVNVIPIDDHPELELPRDEL